MKFWVFRFLLTILFCVNCNAGQSKYYFYKLKVGDTASFVLHRARLLPLYKKSSGSVDEAAVVNQQNIRNIHKITLGEKIYFTKDQVDSALKKGLILVSPEKEITFTELAYEIQKQKLTKKNLFKPEVLGQISEQVALKENIREVATEVAPQQLVDPPKMALAVVEEKSKEVDNTFSEVALMLGAGYSSLNGHDSTNNTRAQLLTKINSQFQLNWIQNWDATAKTAFYLGYKSSQFESNYRGTPIYNANANTSKFGFDYEDKLTQSLNYILGFEQSQKLFYRGLSSISGTGLEINAVPLTSFNIGLKKSLLKAGRYELGTAFDYNYILGSDYQNYVIQNGNAYAIQLYLKESLNNRNINCGVIYAKRIQNTSLINFSETNIDMSCFYKWAY